MLGEVDESILVVSVEVAFSDPLLVLVDGSFRERVGLEILFCFIESVLSILELPHLANREEAQLLRMVDEVDLRESHDGRDDAVGSSGVRNCLAGSGDPTWPVPFSFPTLVVVGFGFRHRKFFDVDLAFFVRRRPVGS